MAIYRETARGLFGGAEPAPAPVRAPQRPVHAAPVQPRAAAATADASPFMAAPAFSSTANDRRTAVRAGASRRPLIIAGAIGLAALAVARIAYMTTADRTPAQSELLTTPPVATPAPIPAPEPAPIVPAEPIPAPPVASAPAPQAAPAPARRTAGAPARRAAPVRSAPVATPAEPTAPPPPTLGSPTTVTLTPATPASPPVVTPEPAPVPPPAPEPVPQ